MTNEEKTKLVNKIVSKLSQTDSNIYYEPTIMIARRVKKYIDNGNKEVQDNLGNLSVEDIQVFLSYH